MKHYGLDRKKLQRELEETARVENELSHKAKTVNEFKISLSDELFARIKELVSSIDWNNIMIVECPEYVYPSDIWIASCVEHVFNSDEAELKEQFKINRKKRGLITFLLRFINFRQNISSVYRKFILRFNFKNMNDESGSDSNIIVPPGNLYYSLIPIRNEKQRQRILH